MLDIALLSEPTPATDGSTALQTGDERLEEISQLAMDGEYLLAADRCQKLLAQHIYDARLVGYFLFGVYMEQGAAALLPILKAVKLCLTVSLPVLGPQGKRDILLDSALQWLFASILKQLEHAERKNDAAWQSLIEVKNLDSVREMKAELIAITAAAAKLVKRPRAVQSISHMEQLLKQAYEAIEVSAESMRLSALSQASGGGKAQAPADKGARDGKPARPDRFDTSDLKGTDKERGRGQKKRKPVPSDEGDDAEGDDDLDEDDEDRDEDRDEDHEDDHDAEDGGRKRARDAKDEDADGWEKPGREDEDEDEDEESTELPELPREEEPPRRKATAAAIRAEDGQGRSITIEGSPALLDLVRRIKAFERLTRRGELLKAAVVADSVLATLDAFDPRVFFPKLLLPFFSGLSEHAPELEAAMAERDSLTFRSLKQLLQLDIDALLK